MGFLKPSTRSSAFFSTIDALFAQSLNSCSLIEVHVNCSRPPRQPSLMRTYRHGGEVRKNKMFNDPKAAWSKKLRKEKMVGLDKRRNEKLSIPEKIVFLETLANRLNS